MCRFASVVSLGWNPVTLVGIETLDGILSMAIHVNFNLKA